MQAFEPAMNQLPFEKEIPLIENFLQQAAGKFILGNEKG